MAKKKPDFQVPKYKKLMVALREGQVIDWSISVLKIPDACWPITKGKNIKVGLVDTGISLNHPDFAGAIDDAKDFTGSRSGVGDVQGHGTATASLVGGRDNGEGIVGAAPECRLFIAKGLGDDGSGSNEGISRCVDWLVSCKVHIISMSLGGPSNSTILKRAIDNAISKGIIVIVAAGNSGPQSNSIGYPARFLAGNPMGLSVGSVNRMLELSRFSSRGEQVDVTAPGERVTVSHPPDTIAVLDGTSFACPIVAGIAALTLAAGVPTDQVCQRIRETVIDLGPSGKDVGYGYGLVDPSRVVKKPDAPPTPPSDGELIFTSDDLTMQGKLKWAQMMSRGLTQIAVR